MKKFIVLLSSLFILTAFVRAEKIGVVNSQQVIIKSKRGLQVQNKIKKFSEKIQKELKSLADEIEKLKKDLESPALNQSTKEKKALAIQNKQTEFKRKREDAQRQYQQLQMRELENLRKEVMPIIQKYGKDNGFSVIFDLPNSGIAYLQEKVEITADIINLYNKFVESKKNNGK